MFVIAGLGNPGGKYEKTRHNVGFQVLDRLAGKYNIEINKKRHHAFCGTGIMEGTKVLFVKPQTFMNLSGESIGAILNFYKLVKFYLHLLSNQLRYAYPLLCLFWRQWVRAG